MKRFIGLFLLFLLLTGCGYVLHPGPVEYADAPKWNTNEAFYVFESEPTNRFKLVCSIIAGSDIGNYPDYQACVQIAKKFAREHGGNGVIVGHDNTVAPHVHNLIKVIYVENSKANS